MAIDILVVEDEYTERRGADAAAGDGDAAGAYSQRRHVQRRHCGHQPAVSGSDPAGYHAAGQLRLEVAEFVRSNRLDCKIIILTAYHEFDFASKALSMDLQDYLLKPVRPSVLLQRVRDVLHLSSPARAATGLAVWPIWPAASRRRCRRSPTCCPT